MSGACKLDKAYNGGCDESAEFCYKPSDYNGTRFGTMYFDEPMKNGNVKKINTESEGVLYHIMLYRHHFSISNETILSIQNDYTAKYFPQTLEALRRRNLDILVELPEVEITYTNFAQSWVHYDYVYKSRHTLGSLFPESGIARTNN